MVRVRTTCNIDLGHCFTHQNFFVFCLQAGVRVGLARNDALKLAAQTVKGAAEMVLSTGSSPAVLKDQGMNNCQNYFDYSEYFLNCCRLSLTRATS